MKELRDVHIAEAWGVGFYVSPFRVWVARALSQFGVVL